MLGGIRGNSSSISKSSCECVCNFQRGKERERRKKRERESGQSWSSVKKLVSVAKRETRYRDRLTLMSRVKEKCVSAIADGRDCETVKEGSERMSRRDSEKYRGERNRKRQTGSNRISKAQLIYTISRRRITGQKACGGGRTGKQFPATGIDHITLRLIKFKHC